ncbi:MAG: hypothetical protein ABIA63_05310 [bacterium]
MNNRSFKICCVSACLGMVFLISGCFQEIYNQTSVNYISPKISKLFQDNPTICFLPLIIKPLSAMPGENVRNIAEEAVMENIKYLNVVSLRHILAQISQNGLNRYYIALCNEFFNKRELDEESLKRLKSKLSVNYIVIAHLQLANVLKDFNGVYRKKIVIQGGIIDLSASSFLWKFTSAAESRSRFHGMLAGKEEIIKDIWAKVAARIPRNPKQSILVPSLDDW